MHRVDTRYEPVACPTCGELTPKAGPGLLDRYCTRCGLAALQAAHRRFTRDHRAYLESRGLNR